MAATTWIANYIYATPAGESLTLTKEIRTESHAAAREYAARVAPADEFVLSLHPKSDEQSLGAVRHSAANLTDKTQDGDQIEQLYDDEEDDEGEKEDL